MNSTEQIRELYEDACRKQADITSRLVLDALATMFDYFAQTIEQVNLDENASDEARRGAEFVRNAIATAAREAAESWRNGGTTTRMDLWKRLRN